MGVAVARTNRLEKTRGLNELLASGERTMIERDGNACHALYFSFSLAMPALSRTW